jgi:hypothetical protein
MTIAIAYWHQCEVRLPVDPFIGHHLITKLAQRFEAFGFRKRRSFPRSRIRRGLRWLFLAPYFRLVRIVHDPWYAYTTSGKTAQFRAMPHKDHRYGIQLVDSDVLEDALRSIKEFSGRVENLKKEISSLASGS